MLRFNQIAALTAALLLVIPWGFTSAAGEAKLQGKDGLDLSKTKGFVADWEQRDRFPDTVSLAYYYVYSQMALGRKVPSAVRKKIISSINACQRKDGGFGSHPHFSLHSTVMDTYYAFKTLKLLNGLGEADWKRAAAFIRARASKNGGFFNKEGDKGTSLAATCWAIEVLLGVESLTPETAEKASRFILSFREKGKGFAMVKGKPSSPKATGMAVRALDLMKRLTPEIKSDVVRYLKGTRYSGLIKNRKYTTYPYVEHLCYVLEAMKRAGSLKEFDTVAIRDFIKRLYIPFNGGFGPRPGLGSTPPSTYHALRSLALLGDLKDPEQ